MPLSKLCTLSKRRRPIIKPCRTCTRATQGYKPSDDDKAESSPDIPTDLTLPQQLLMKQYAEQVEQMSDKECRELAVEIARQMMVKDNILRKMLKKDINFGIEPPDPDLFNQPDKDN